MNNQKVSLSEYSVTEDTEAVTENAAPVSNSMRRSAIFCEEFLNNLDNAESWNGTYFNKTPILKVVNF